MTIATTLKLQMCTGPSSSIPFSVMFIVRGVCAVGDVEPLWNEASSLSFLLNMPMLAVQMGYDQAEKFGGGEREGEKRGRKGPKRCCGGVYEGVPRGLYKLIVFLIFFGCILIGWTEVIVFREPTTSFGMQPDRLSPTTLAIDYLGRRYREPSQSRSAAICCFLRVADEESRCHLQGSTSLSASLRETSWTVASNGSSPGRFLLAALGRYNSDPRRWLAPRLLNQKPSINVLLRHQVWSC